MTPEQIRQTLEGYMATWSDVPVAYDGNPAPPAVVSAQESGAPWVRFTINPGPTINRGITDRPCPRRTGVVFIQIFIKRDTGTSAAQTVADSLVDHWENETLGAMWLLEASTQRVGPDANYYQLNLTIPYRAD